MTRALYIHIPFCRSICPFCAFAVHGDKHSLHPPFLAALKREIELLAATHERGASRIESVYFGGGTPSTLSLREVEGLVDSLSAAFSFADGVEIAFEVNPEDAARDYLIGLAELGINRLSLGLQSLDGGTLRALGRNHDPQGSEAALLAVRKHGPANFNLDLLFGAPSIAPERFEEDVECAVASQAPHISLYGLDIESGTPFGRDATVRDWAERHREEQAEVYLRVSATLRERGYRHYEVSNFCLPGHAGRQNEIVWDGGEYLGFGPGAHSYTGNIRRHNERHLRAYLRKLEAGSRPTAFEERLTSLQRANEALMLALRRDTGLHVPAWEESHGMHWGDKEAELISRLEEQGKAVWRNDTLTLTAEGLLVADEITARLAGSDG